MTSSGVQW